MAQNVIDDAVAAPASLAGFGLPAASAFAFAMAYTCFHAMRAGLLTRFWGSLGAALGVASYLRSSSSRCSGSSTSACCRRLDAARPSARLGGGRGDPLADARRAGRGVAAG